MKAAEFIVKLEGLISQYENENGILLTDIALNAKVLNFGPFREKETEVIREIKLTCQKIK